MIVDRLSPRMERLRQPSVVVHAFKKTVSHIRSHNWFADVLELDRATVDYPSFLESFTAELAKPSKWKNDPVRLVAAPKSQTWTGDEKTWRPRKNNEAVKLRPLAHVSLHDQVAATLLMMGAADAVETAQGDPRLDIRVSDNRRRIVSYGNRLFCDDAGKGKLWHRWGSSRVYRAYFTDYRTFVERPTAVINSLGERSGTKLVVVQADLEKFYDRVRPELLHDKLVKHVPRTTKTYRSFVKRLLNWRWHGEDLPDAKAILETEGTTASRLALPQGLVAAGFFANVVLMDFDQAMIGNFGKDIVPGVRLHDYCRYVDDLRLVVEVGEGSDLDQLKPLIVEALHGLLKEHATGLNINAGKTELTSPRDPKHVTVPVSRSMRRIQAGFSGGFDDRGGEGLLMTLDGLFQSAMLNQLHDPVGASPLHMVGDVKDETVVRFSANRYRSVFRSLRPLLEEGLAQAVQYGEVEEGAHDKLKPGISREEADQRAMVFGRRLVQAWVDNPGNVRLLRIGLDLYPDATVVAAILKRLQEHIASDAGVKGVREVALYCLAEVFRAAATETGLVPNREQMPDSVDLTAFRATLRDAARQLVDDSWDSLPWFCQQQILLFLAADSSVGFNLDGLQSDQNRETLAFLQFLRGGAVKDPHEWAVFAVLARQSFLDAEDADKLILPQLSPARLDEVARLAPSVAEEWIERHASVRKVAAKMQGLLHRLSLPLRTVPADPKQMVVTLVHEARQWNCRARDERELVKLALKWLERYKPRNTQHAPSTLTLKFDGATFEYDFDEPVDNPLYRGPAAEGMSEWDWRWELGLLLRFVMTGRADPTQPLRPTSWREAEYCYRPPSWHWQVRQFSLFNGRDGIGPDWNPVSSWMESFLSALMHWQGAHAPPPPFDKPLSRKRAKRLCAERLAALTKDTGAMSKALFLTIAPRPRFTTTSDKQSPLRVCVAQLGVPDCNNPASPAALSAHDPTMSFPEARRSYRRHLTSVLAGIDQQLRVRASHLGTAGLDLLVMPELSVHPDDVRPRLLPFVRKHRCVAFAGMTYRECHPGGNLVNAAVWIVPEFSPSRGLQVKIYAQGKRYLAREEQALLPQRLLEHRPCQWLLNLTAASPSDRLSVILSGSVCYDATDLALVADLRDRADVYLIAALNTDVGTFDTMTGALHYHMFQTVILANNAHHGGSNAYAPLKSHEKQLFHLHGPNQSVMGFLDIDPAVLTARGKTAMADDASRWKTPPAGWFSRKN